VPGLHNISDPDGGTSAVDSVVIQSNLYALQMAVSVAAVAQGCCA